MSCGRHWPGTAGSATSTTRLDLRPGHGPGASSPLVFADDGVWHDGESFHARRLPVYSGDPNSAAIHKLPQHMAKVAYSPSHPNADFDDWRGGVGTARCTWVAGEQGEQAEGTSDGGLDLLIDTWLEPGTSVGWHRHDSTEEVYYVLAGELEVWTDDGRGGLHRFAVPAGGASRVGPGMSHAARAGDAGARFVVVAIKTPQQQ